MAQARFVTSPRGESMPEPLFEHTDGDAMTVEEITREKGEEAEGQKEDAMEAQEADDWIMRASFEKRTSSSGPASPEATRICDQDQAPFDQNHEKKDVK